MSKVGNIKLVAVKIDVKLTFKNIILLILVIKFNTEVLITG